MDGIKVGFRFLQQQVVSSFSILNFVLDKRCASEKLELRSDLRSACSLCWYLHRIILTTYR